MPTIARRTVFGRRNSHRMIYTVKCGGAGQSSTTRAFARLGRVRNPDRHERWFYSEPAE